MSFTFNIEEGKIVKIDTSTGRTVTEWRPVGTKVIDLVIVRNVLVVREDHKDFPAEKSNVYALNSDLGLLWTADRPTDFDVYTMLMAGQRQISAMSQSGCVYQLDFDSGAVVDVKARGQIDVSDLWRNLPSWKSFFSLAGGSILYCVSALLIMYGIVQIMGPALTTSRIVKELLPGIGVLNLYELSLLGVLLFIVIWHNVTDDAISLVVLVALFLMGNGIALDTMATEGPKITLGIGVACCVVAAAQLFALRRYILPKLGSCSLAAGAIILIWNSVCGPILAVQKIGLPSTTAFRREPWLVAWLVVLGAAILVLIQFAGKRQQISEERKQEPFLYTPTMADVFMLIILASAGMHMYAMAYMFNLPYTFGDFIPLIAIGSLVLVELLRNTGKRLAEAEVFVACIPLAAVILGILGKTITASAAWGVTLLWYPPIMLGLVGAALVWLSFLNRRTWLWYVAIAYAVGVLFTLGFSPLKPYEVNWRLTGVALTLILLGLGIWLRNGNLCFAAVLIAAIGLATTKAFEVFADKTLHVEVGSGVLGLVGLATLIIYAIYGKKLERVLAILAGLGLMMFLFDFLPERTGWQDLPMVIGVVGLCAGLRIRTKDLGPMLPVGIPVAWRVWVYGNNMSAWGYVVLSFFVLAAGAWASVRKGRKQRLASTESGGKGE